MRTGYSVAKITALCGLAAAHALGAGDGWMTSLLAAAWLSVALCLLRGAPVLLAGFANRAPAIPRERYRGAGS